MKDAPQLQHVMSLVDGDEDAASLRALVREQLTRPRAREDSDEVVVMDYRAINGSFDHLILIACVDGMVGNSAQALNEQALQAFQDAPAHATRDCIVSYFTRIDKSMADQARINYTRAKTENGTLLAMSKPTPFLTAETSKRPSTMSGQALLRTYGLN